jgi:hypothetical protein
MKPMSPPMFLVACVVGAPCAAQEVEPTDDVDVNYRETYDNPLFDADEESQPSLAVETDPDSPSDTITAQEFFELCGDASGNTLCEAEAVERHADAPTAPNDTIAAQDFEPRGDVAVYALYDVGAVKTHADSALASSDTMTARDLELPRDVGVDYRQLHENLLYEAEEDQPSLVVEAPAHSALAPGDTLIAQEVEPREVSADPPQDADPVETSADSTLARGDTLIAREVEPGEVGADPPHDSDPVETPADATLALSETMTAQEVEPGDVGVDSPYDAGAVETAADSALAPSDTMTAQEFELRGSVGVDYRQFYEDPLYDAGEENQPSLAAETHADWALAPSDTITLSLFARWDDADEARTHADLREAKWVHRETNWDVEIGNSLVFWGVTESQHLVDVINQRDSVEDVTGDARLGQPLLRARYFDEGFSLEGYVMPAFRERPFPEAPGRMRLPIPVAADDAQFESSDGRNHWDYALRGTLSAGPMDIGLSVFKGTNREPLLLPTKQALTPYYEQITQYSVDLQATSGPTLWKLEARYRDSDRGAELAYVAGLEHAFYQFMGTPADVSLLLEHNWDERGSRATTPFQNDVFVGARVAFNDEASSEALFGVVADLEEGGAFGRLRASTRLAERYRVSFEAYWFDSNSQRDPIHAVRHEDHVQMSVRYFF